MKLRNQKGQSMVVSIVFLTVLMGMSALVIDVGSWYRAHRAAQSTADASALAGARKAAASTTRRAPNPRNLCISAVRNSANGLKQADLTADCVSDWQPGHDVVVTATYPYSISLFGLFSKSGNLTSTTTERIE